MKLSKTQTYDTYVKLFEQVSDYAMILMDTEGNILDWNRGAEKIKGYRPEEILGGNFRQFYTEGDLRKGKPQHLLEIAAEKGSVQDEGWRVRKDGSTFWGSITITAIRDDNNQLIGFGKVTRDLTGKKAAEVATKEYARQLEKKNRELEASEMRFRHMMEEVQDYAILLLDVEGNVQNWHQGVEKIKGYKAEEIIGKNFRIFYTAEDKASGKPDRILTTAREKGRAQDEGFRVRKNGTTFWGSITITTIHSDDGEVIGFTKVTRDLTERKEAEDARREYTRRLELKNSELEQLAYITSHDLLEPINTINGFIQLLEKENEGTMNPEASQYMNFIAEASHRMGSLVTDLLEYSRLGASRKEEEVDCNALVEDVQKDLSSIISQTGAEISVSPLPWVKGYKTELRLLFQNLLSNAIKFRKAKDIPRIRISAVKEKNGVKICVSDNGIGIPNEYQERIFRIFQRLHSREQYSGTGIGLAHCRKIVEMHGGEIGVESRVGQGSTFYFTISRSKVLRNSD